MVKTVNLLGSTKLKCMLQWTSGTEKLIEYYSICGGIGDILREFQRLKKFIFQSKIMRDFTISVCCLNCTSKCLKKRKLITTWLY